MLPETAPHRIPTQRAPAPVAISKRDDLNRAEEHWSMGYLLNELGNLPLDDKVWPAPGSEDTKLGCLLEPEVDHGEAEVYT
jgi:hypothetical protein